MNTVVLALMMVVTVMTWLKLTFLKTWQMAATAACCTLFVGLSWPLAIQQSNNEIGEWLASPTMMLNTSVILTLEVLWQIAYCMLSGRMLYKEPVSKRVLWLYRTLRFFPGILIFPVLFYLLVEVIYLFPGVSFPLIAWTMACAMLLLIPAGVWAIRWFLPEKSIRLEMLFLCSTLVLILGILVTVNGTTSFKGSDPIEWGALGTFCLMAIACAVAGYFIHLHAINKKVK